ncbi:RNA polymerase, sigma 37 subunit, RpsB/SigB [Mycolicibacterium chubuense NBB4]|uniref:RNA polymerase, sigma 37 subunit, RpsB/SigB n=1 Tax=Mycolicibacterium chubuense (strain NBB4) TaxID=710421 RepID=I4BJL7_MYCCN|nr:SigB/SigF/SigG family RNA polymerase sigma factor [Mycolicibacterium chubuense]AFM17474.1 RNA polymerase, sigma 37 subunit, RpsB/SigB [Mycolicibacterium chubuense NBB4]
MRTAGAEVQHRRADAPRRWPATEPDSTWIHSAFVRLHRLPQESTEYGRLRNRIIEECLPLAERIARRYDRRGETHDDLVQVARVGLMNAVNRFDPDAGSEFLAFAIPTMLGEVKRYFRDCSWSVNVPRRLKDLYPALGPLTTEMTQRLGRSPTAGELAEALGVDRDEVVETLTAAAGFKARSIDYSSSRDDDRPTLVDRMGGPDPGIGTVEDRDALRAQLECLPEREYWIVIMRFFESLTQTEIAQRMGISQMHVSRLLTQSLARLRDGMLDPPHVA